MFHNYNEFPHFITADKMIEATSSKDSDLYEMRKGITNMLISIIPAYKQNNRAILLSYDLRNRNYRQIKTIHDELTERGFTMIYDMQIRKGGGYITQKIKFEDIDPYANMPTNMMIQYE